MGKDYYKSLGVDKNASTDEIKSAYRKLAKKYHPDANPGDKTAETKFKEVSEAYAVLSDPQKRATYDQVGSSAFDGSQGSAYNAADFDFSEIFKSAFGGGFGGFGGFEDLFGDFFGGGASRANASVKGNNVFAQVQIDLLEAIFGCKKIISISLDCVCDDCRGTGARPGTFPENCKKCGGSGRVHIQRQSMFGSISIQMSTCNVCHGTGKVIREKCQKCRGTGIIKQEKKLEIDIPKGIANDQTIRISNKGNAGKNGGPNGDLLVTVYVKPHKYFVRKGDDLYLDVPIEFIQAVLGDEIEIQTVYGPEKIKIRPGTQSGTVFTLKNKGVPNVQNNRMIGDLILKLNVNVPTNISDKQKKLLKEFFADNINSKDKKKSFFDMLKDTFKN